MASGLLMLLDDITTILDDIATLTKVAAKKTAGVLGDDLALNAQQVTGVDATREIPVVWAVAKGSFINKTILVPAALGLSYFAPWSITPLLIVGGLFLCFEGVEKLAHKFLHKHDAEEHEKELHEAVLDPTQDLVAVEKTKIKGAIRTDFILSAEIIVITLGTVAAQPLLTQVLVLCAISLLMTVGVYGLVAGIVKLDDLGMKLIATDGEPLAGEPLAGEPLASAPMTMRRRIGYGILTAAPYLMKFLSIAGTIAMFLVGGGILTHNWPAVHHAIESIAQPLSEISNVGGALASLTQMLLDALVGILAGALVVLVVTMIGKLVRKKPA